MLHKLTGTQHMDGTFIKFQKLKVTQLVTSLLFIEGLITQLKQIIIKIESASPLKYFKLIWNKNYCNPKMAVYRSVTDSV